MWWMDSRLENASASNDSATAERLVEAVDNTDVQSEPLESIFRALRSTEDERPHATGSTTASAEDLGCKSQLEDAGCWTAGNESSELCFDFLTPSPLATCGLERPIASDQSRFQRSGIERFFAERMGVGQWMSSEFQPRRDPAAECLIVAAAWRLTPGIVGLHSKMFVSHDADIGQVLEPEGYPYAATETECGCQGKIQQLTDELESQSVAFDKERRQLAMQMEELANSLASSRSHVVHEMSLRAAAEGSITRIETRHVNEQRRLHCEFQNLHEKCGSLDARGRQFARELASKTLELNNQRAQSEYLLAASKLNYQKDLAKLRTTLSNQQREGCKAELVVDKLSRRLAVTSRDLQKSRRKYERLARRSSDEQKRSSKRNRREIDQLLSVIRDQQDQLFKSRRQSSGLKQELLAEQAKVHELSGELEAAQAGSRAHASKYQQGRQRIAELNAELQEKSSREKQLQDDLAKELEQKAELRTAIATLRGHIHRRDERIAEIEHTVSGEMEQADKLRRRLTVASSDSEAMESICTWLLFASWLERSLSDKRLTAANCRVAELARQINQVDSELSDTRQRLSAAKQTNETQGKMLISTLAIDQEVRKLRDELVSERVLVEAKNHELRSKNQGLASSNALLQSKVHALASQSADLQSRLQKLTLSREVLKSRVSEIESLTDQLTEKQRVLTARNLHLETESRGLRLRSEQLESGHESLAQWKRYLESQVAEAAADSLRLLELQSASEKCRQELKSKLDQAGRSKQQSELAADEQKRRSAAKYRDWQRRVEGMQTEIAERNESIRRLRLQCDRLSGQLSEAEAAGTRDRVEASSAIQQIAQECKAFKDKARQLRSEKDDLQRQFSKLRRQWMDERQRRMGQDAEARRQLRDWMEENRRLSRKLETLDLHRDSMQRQVDELQVELRQTNQECRLKQSKLEHTQEKCVAEQQLYLAACQQVDDLQRQVRASQQAIAAGEAKELSLSDQVDERQRELESLRQTSKSQQSDFERQSREHHEQALVIKRNLDVLREEAKRRCRQRWELLQEIERRDAELESTTQSQQSAIDELASNELIRAKLEQQLDRTLRLLLTEAAGRRKAEVALSRAAEQVGETSLARITKQQISAETKMQRLRAELSATHQKLKRERRKAEQNKSDLQRENAQLQQQLQEQHFRKAS